MIISIMCLFGLSYEHPKGDYTFFTGSLSRTSLFAEELALSIESFVSEPFRNAWLRIE